MTAHQESNPSTETSYKNSKSHLVNDQGNYGNGQCAHPCASKKSNSWNKHSGHLINCLIDPGYKHMTNSTTFFPQTVW